MRVNLALVDEALLVLVHELDRIFDRDDVILPLPVDRIHHRAQRRRLARAGRTGDEDEPLRQPAQRHDRGRQAELLGGEDLARNHAEHGARPLAIQEDVGAEAREPLDFIGEVGVVDGRELRPVLLRHDLLEQRRRGLRRERHGRRVERLHVAVLPDERRHADRDVQVGCACGDHLPEQIVDCVRGPGHGHCISLNSTTCSMFTMNVSDPDSTYRNISGVRAKSLSRSRPAGR